MSSKKGAKSKGGKQKSSVTIDDASAPVGVKGVTDARIEAQSQVDTLIAQHYIGLGTLNFDEEDVQFTDLDRSLQFGTHNSRPLLSKHVSRLSQELRTNFILDERIAIHLPILPEWLDDDSLKRITATKTADWKKPDILTQLPIANIKYDLIKKQGLKPLSGHVCTASPKMI
jgi:hypothetical protein